MDDEARGFKVSRPSPAPARKRIAPRTVGIHRILNGWSTSGNTPRVQGSVSGTAQRNSRWAMDMTHVAGGRGGLSAPGCGD